jgi:hypothetical protein
MMFQIEARVICAECHVIFIESSDDNLCFHCDGHLLDISSDTSLLEAKESLYPVKQPSLKLWEVMYWSIGFMIAAVVAYFLTQPPVNWRFVAEGLFVALIWSENFNNARQIDAHIHRTLGELEEQENEHQDFGEDSAFDGQWDRYTQPENWAECW